MLPLLLAFNPVVLYEWAGASRALRMYRIVVIAVWAVLCTVCTALTNTSRIWPELLGLVVHATYASNVALYGSMCHALYAPLRPRETLSERLRRTWGQQVRMYANWDDVPLEPCILVGNYPRERVESGIPLMCAPQVAMLMDEGVVRSLRIPHVRHIATSSDGKQFDRIRSDVRRALFRDRAHVFAYAHHGGDLPRWRTGIFRIAAALGVPVVPMAIDHLRVNAWGGLPAHPVFRVIVGAPLRQVDPDAALLETRQWLRTALERIDAFHAFFREK